MYDCIIIGTGPTGLYAAYRLQHLNLLLLEKNSTIGGRVGNASFQGVNVVTGAGIGRMNKDILLKNLLIDLNLWNDNNSFEVRKTFSRAAQSRQVDMVAILQFLQEKLQQVPVSSLTFREFALKFLPKNIYENFVMTTGYSDFENMAAHDAFYNYGFDDNGNSSWEAFPVPWKKMVRELAKKVGYHRILFGKEVVNIDSKTKFVKITTTQKEFFLAKRCILATNIETLMRLLPEKYSVYKQIGGQPFLRVYAKIDDKYMSKKVSGTTIVSTSLRKISCIDVEKGVYLIAYCDNKDALLLCHYIQNTRVNREFWSEQIREALTLPSSPSIEAIRGFFWPIGTHYYKPTEHQLKRKEFIKKAQHPYPNVQVCGEVVALNQGWTNSAFESVEAILDMTTQEKKLFSIFTKGGGSKTVVPTSSCKKPEKTFDAQQEAFINMPIEQSGKFYGIPGGGKTTAIIERLVRTVKKGKIPDTNGFLLVTFSNQAVRDFIDKGDDHSVFHENTVSTFHSLAGKILRYLSKNSDMTIKDTTLKKVVGYCTSVLEGMTPAQIRNIPLLSDVRCITVDEAQDINSSQYYFIKMLADKLTLPLVLVGDPNQSIYGFQGGSSRFLLEHSGFCVQSTVNYRSTPEIVNILNAIMPVPLAHGMLMTSSTRSSHCFLPRLLIGSMKEILSNIFVRVKEFLHRGVEGKTLAVIGPVKRSQKYDEKYSSLSLNDVYMFLHKNDIPCIRHYNDTDVDGEKVQSDPKEGKRRTKAKEKDVTSWSKIHFLTVHGSKGLEFDEVILLNYQLNTQNRRPKDKEQYRTFEYIWYVGFSRPKEILTVYHLENNAIWPGYKETLYPLGHMYAFDVSGKPVKL